MEELAHSENLKFSAEICLRVRIPPPAPDSLSRPAPRVEERGDFFCTRFAGSIASHRRSMICGSLLPIPPRLSNRDIPPPLQISSPPVPFFPRRRIGGLYSIRRAAPLFGLAGRNTIAFLPAFPYRWAGRFVSRSSPRFPIRPIGFSLPSSPRFPPSGSVSPLLSAFLYDRRGECVFFVCISVFTVDSAAACDTLTNRYTCGRGVTADTPDLGSGGEIRVGSNPTARTITTPSPLLQPVQVAAGAGFFHAAETKIQSMAQARTKQTCHI